MIALASALSAAKGVPVDGDWLCALHRDPDDPMTVTLLNFRQLTSEESSAALAADQLLSAMTSHSAMQDLRGATEDLLAEIDAIEVCGHSVNVRPGAGDRLERTFKGWLSAFKSFDDRTSHWLSREFGGKNSPEYERFKRLLSEEFDNNFAHRLCCGLRNAAEHAGRVVNGLGFFAREAQLSAATKKCPETATKLPAGGHETCPLTVMGSARHDVVCLAAIRG